MFFTEKKLSEYLRSRSQENNEKIEQFMKVIGDRTYIEEDIDLLEKGDLIFKRNYKVGWSYDDISREMRAKKSLERIFRKIKEKTIESYCDVGCGYGEKVKIAYELGLKRTVGIDICNRWNNDELYDERIEFICTDISQNMVEEKFDLVTSFCAFEHFENPVKMFESMRKMVKPGGYLYIEFGPIWNSAYGHHCYDSIAFPYYHLLFSDKVIDTYKRLHEIKDEQYYNKWSAYDYMYMFLKCNEFVLKNFEVLYNFTDYYFVESFPFLFEKFKLDDLYVSGFELLYKNVN